MFKKFILSLLIICTLLSIKDIQGASNDSTNIEELVPYKWTPISDVSALLIGSWRISENQHGMYSLIWKRINGEWVIVADHSSD